MLRFHDRCPVRKAQYSQFLRTVRPRSSKNPDDADGEDHIAGTLRYAITYDRTPGVTYHGAWRFSTSSAAWPPNG